MLSNQTTPGRSQLVEWLNSILGLTYTKIEDCTNGAAFCQIFDAIYPGTIYMPRVNFKASLAHQNFENYKVLQEAFTKNKIKFNIDVDGLSKGKQQSLLEMLQFLFQFYEQTKPHPPYNASEIRNRTSKRSIPMRTRRFNMLNGKLVTASTSDDSPGKSGKSGSAQKSSDEKSEAQSDSGKSSQKSGPTVIHIQDQALKAKMKALKNEAAEFKEKYEDMLQERDFYFDKLRKVEDFCQDHENNELIQSILSIIYQTDEALGFVPPEDD